MPTLNSTIASLESVFVIVPMLNEQDSIGLVLQGLPSVRKVVVVDNGSTDNGPAIARESNADVISEPQRGYGKACLTGIAHVENEVAKLDADEDWIIVFIDGDFSDHPEELSDLVRPISANEYDFVVGSRSTGNRQAGAMHFQAIFGNWLACTMMRLFWGARFTDLGPFRAIRYSSLKNLNMQDANYGWTIEMQIKAVVKGLRWTEIPVSYRQRIGVSKISGTISGTVKAGYKILYTIFKYRFFSNIRT